MKKTNKVVFSLVLFKNSKTKVCMKYEVHCHDFRQIFFNNDLFDVGDFVPSRQTNKFAIDTVLTMQLPYAYRIIRLVVSFQEVKKKKKKYRVRRFILQFESRSRISLKLSHWIIIFVVTLEKVKLRGKWTDRTSVRCSNAIEHSRKSGK